MGRTQRPVPAHVVGEVMDALPQLAGSELRWTHGAFHFVGLVPGRFALRIRMGANRREAIAAEEHATRLFADLGLALRTPDVVIPAIHAADWSAFGCTAIDGSTMQPSSWAEDRGILIPLLEELAAIEAAPTVPEPRSWCGGAEWAAIVAAITHDFEPAARLLAAAAVEAALECSGQPTGIRHGDFGPHNLLLTASGLALIDADNLCAGEPAIDVAPLLGFYPPADLARDFTPELLERAALVRRSLPLQVAAAAHLADDPGLRDHALSNFLRRL